MDLLENEFYIVYEFYHFAGATHLAVSRAEKKNKSYTCIPDAALASSSLRVNATRVRFVTKNKDLAVAINKALREKYKVHSAAIDNANKQYKNDQALIITKAEKYGLDA